MKTLSFVVLAVFFASCATQPYRPYAREVKKLPGKAGVIALKSEHVPEDRTYADTLMVKNCGDSTVNVKEEGEVQVGETTTTNSKTQDRHEANGFNLSGFKVLTGGSTPTKDTAKTSTVVALKEWQINYECTAVAAAKSTSKKK